MIATDLRTWLRSPLATTFAIGIAVGGGAGCGGGKGAPYPDGGQQLGTGGRATTVPDGGGGTGGGGTGGVTTDAAVGPDGPAATGSIRLLVGPAALVSPGPSCSYGLVPVGAATPERWCGAVRPGAVSGTISLSVFNLTKAIAGTALTCATGDANCFQLSANLSTAADAAPRFFGDTLVYYEAQSVLAWRPGWTAGRVLVPHDQPASCAAGPATAICIKATTNAAILNLYAGPIDTQTGPALTLIEPVDATVGNVNFSVDQLSVLWSTTTGVVGAPEVLKMQTIGDAATRRTVATNVTAWSQSPDGSRWLWLSQPAMDPVAMTITGTLQTAPFPAGTAPTDVHTRVVQYAPWTANSLMVLATGTLGFDLKAIANVDSPVATARVIEADDVVGFSDLTAGGTVLYSNDFAQPDPLDPNNVLVNLLSSSADATAKCTVTNTAEADPSAYLNRSGTGVGWVLASAASPTLFEGRFTTLPGCATATFSTTLSGYLDVSAGVVLLENFSMTAFTTALGLAPYTATGTLGAKIPIHPAANPTVMPLFPDTPRIVYSLNQTAFEGGIYVSAPLTGLTQPFLATSPNAAFGTTAATRLMRASAGKMGATAIRTAPGAAPSLAATSRALLRSLLPNRWGTKTPLLMPGRLAAAASATRARPLRSTSAR
jgi:hypothetical protein